jgi:hypothetical protein
MQLNALLASPGFQAWMEGEPLDVASLLYTPAGKPRVSIFSIAHLGEAERMFFVTMLLSAVLAWMRSQPGTTTCARCSTWTRSSASSRPRPTRRRSSRC